MKPMTKNMWRDIKDNLGRFIAIILIILLGTLIFVGVKAAGPGLNDSLDTTVRQQHLSDVQLLSTTGFDKTDVKTAQKVAGTKAESIKFKYAIGGKNDSVVALYGYQPQTSQNKLKLRSGHLPKTNHQIVLDQLAKKDYGYHLGDQFTFKKSADLKQQTYTVVGFADSPTYIDYASRGVANVGDGTVRFFAYLPSNQLNLPSATLLNIRFASLQKKNTYSHQYQSVVDHKITKLKAVFKTRAKDRDQTLQQPLREQQVQLTQAKQQFNANQAQLDPNLASAQKKQLTAQQAQLSAAKKKLTTTYTWQTRSDLPGFSDFGDSSDRIAAIANVFPVFFFLIAALITFTTITRMVEESRQQIGTFKALGYAKTTIAKNFITYALLAGLIGALAGGIIGNFTLPQLVISLYQMSIPLISDVPFMWSIFAIAIVFSLLATVGAAVIVTIQQLQEKPAALMRPRAPKSAKRIFLEKITPLWQKLSFNQKVSYRNLFRYKSRVIMTIIGIAGGTALLLTGFGLRDSISGTADKQFSEVTHYDATVALNHNNQATKAQQVLQINAHYQSAAQINATTGTVKKHGQHVSDVHLYTPQQPQTFQKYVNLGQKLPKNGIIISQKIADQLKVKTGDSLTLTTTAGKTAHLKIKAVAPNYMGVFAYMSPQAYQTAFKTKAPVNALLVRLKHMNKPQQNHLAKQLLSHGDAQGTSFSSAQVTSVHTMSQSMNSIIFIFILLSGVLSFVVLYNLTNINISERVRELSTIKVLGFYDREVTTYVVRENVILTVIGIVLGYGIGWALLAFILKQAATPLVIFPIIISWQGYLFSTLLMVIFTLIVMLVTHHKLRQINMIDALKSNE